MFYCTACFRLSYNSSKFGFQSNLQVELKEAVRRLNTIHTRSLDFFITHAFKLARDLQATPKRISYVRAEENKLYNNLLEMVCTGPGEYPYDL